VGSLECPGTFSLTASGNGIGITFAPTGNDYDVLEYVAELYQGPTMRQTITIPVTSKTLQMTGSFSNLIAGSTYTVKVKAVAHTIESGYCTKGISLSSCLAPIRINTITFCPPPVITPGDPDCALPLGITTSCDNI
jgi:hypothetical protein